MEVREIPEGSVEVQTGLRAYLQTSTINGRVYSWYTLYSAEGYCFYDLTDEYCDKDGNLIPEEDVLPTQRIYYQYMCLSSLTSTVEQINARFVSVPIQEGFDNLEIT